jgi:GT2 family glycosyltransferase
VVSAPGRPSVVVLGMATAMPVAGVLWQTLHYLLGFERLGYAAHYVELHGRTPAMLMTTERDDGAARAAGLLAAVMRRFGLAGRWAYRALHDDGRLFGMTEGELRRVLDRASLVVNLHGGTEPLPELTAGDRLVYLETDPVQLQLELHGGWQPAIDFLEPHCAFFTFAENLGNPDCGLPVSERFAFRPTRQPVVPELWAAAAPPAHDRFTTIGNWRQSWRELDHEGRRLSWSKDQQFERLLDLPQRLGRRFELALGSYTAEDQARLEAHGWRVRRAMDFSMDLHAYRRFIAESAGEFTVAKEQNVALRSGWFSDRSATYLAAGRPVVTQDTGFGCALPTGEGLFAFTGADDVAAALEAIDADPGRHRRAAAALAREHFAPEVVLGAMLDHLGLPHGAQGTVRSVPWPHDLDLTPTSRRPPELPEATLAAVLGADPGARARRPAPLRPSASVVVVSWNTRAFTRMCVETVLGTVGGDAELIVVDNASADGSLADLQAIAAKDGRLTVLANATNAGFPRACNQGLAAARGEHLVLLNSDTLVAPGWLEGLLAHLDHAGLVGPVTNRIGNEAEVPVGYTTYGGFEREAAARAAERRGEGFAIPTPAMFCLALHRDTHARLGPLDEGFGVGTLEDDDYAARARRAGIAMRCAEDVLVHHFGEASFGRLYADGERNRVLERNRARFAQKWGTPWTPYERREDPGQAALVERTRRLMAERLPPGARVLVVSKGDERLVDVEHVRARHFPATADGTWAGHHPVDGADALRRLAAAPADFIVFPRHALWWLDFYGELARHLGDEPVVRDEACEVYAVGAR